MLWSLIPFKKRKRTRWLLALALLAIIAYALNVEQAERVTTQPGDELHRQMGVDTTGKHQKGFHSDGGMPRGDGSDAEMWRLGLQPPVWKSKYKGQANLHVFEDWCGSSTDQLRKNIHYPLRPHLRTTVTKLAVSPNRTNYGLRIFGFLHPDADGEYMFAVASDDNAEFWLSVNEDPGHLRCIALVGKTGREWTAPGEYGKYKSQTSHPITLSAKEKYYFEVIHKQDDKGVDHVEVAWHLNIVGEQFSIIGPEHISLYVNEYGVQLGEVAHIPQSAASHTKPLALAPKHPIRPEKYHAEMLQVDPRDYFYKIPMVDVKSLHDVLPDCNYHPSYIIKNFPLKRYQGLQFVHLSYVYPNDYTRLTHMEDRNKCFYNIKKNGFGFRNNMVMDNLEKRKKSFTKDQNLLSKQAVSSTKENILERVADEGNEITCNLKKISRVSVPTKDTLNTLVGDVQTNEKGFTEIRRQLVSNKKMQNPEEDQINETNNVHVVAEGEDQVQSDPAAKRGGLEAVLKGFYEDGNDDAIPLDMPDHEVNWVQTFNVIPVDFHSLRTHLLDKWCNVSGNLLMSSVDAQQVVNAFMERLNEKQPGRFSLLKVVNVEKRTDAPHSGRYLLELELQEVGKGRFCLSHYIYAHQQGSLHHSKQRKLLLCYPLGFAWNPSATVYFIVPVRNQARWVLQFITDMEQLYKATGDSNFKVIICDYSSTDMNMELALKRSTFPSFQYKRLTGTFQRSAGLQAGINLIRDQHSIVFLCDLHLHFPHSIINSIRKHCVEGKMVFAPVVMRLECGATPQEPDGFWEVNGFGLLGIYKSDLDLVGGMNTMEFGDRWGGEDWELLDRVLKAGLEVERLFLRNFLHYYHSHRGMWDWVPT